MKEKAAYNPMNDTTEVLPFSGVIFDMDGTLIESTEADYQAWKRLFGDYGRNLSYNDYKPLLGIKSANVVRDILGISDKKEAADCLTAKLEYFKEVVSIKGILPVPGALEFVKHVSTLPVKIALATSSRSPKMKMVMEQLGFIKYFDVIVTGEEVLNSKPAPDIFIVAANKLGIPARECIVIEDALNGVVAAKRASMKCIAITTTHEAAQLNNVADIVIDSFVDTNLLEVMERLEV